MGMLHETEKERHTHRGKKAVMCMFVLPDEVRENVQVWHTLGGGKGEKAKKGSALFGEC